MTRGNAPRWARLSVGMAGAGAMLLQWSADQLDAGRSRPDRTGCLTIRGTLVAAGVRTDDSSGVGAADVIFAGDRADHDEPADWLGGILGRNPGCQVVAACDKPGDCVIATRDDGIRALSVDGHETARICAFACAVFAYGWLTADLPLAALEPIRLTIRRPEPAASPDAAEAGARLLFFCLRYS